MHTPPTPDGRLRPSCDMNAQVARCREPLDVAWMRDWLDVHLDGLDWPAVVSSSVIEDAVLKTYPRWQTRLPRLREIISRSLHAAGYVRRSVKGHSWDRCGVSQVSRDIARQAGVLINTGE